MEIVGYEVCEAGSPLALDNGQFTMFPKRDKHLFIMRLCTDYSYKKIGQYFGLSTGRAQQIYYRVLMRLFHKMRDNHLILTENSEKKNIFVFKI